MVVLLAGDMLVVAGWGLGFGALSLGCFQPVVGGGDEGRGAGFIFSLGSIICDSIDLVFLSIHICLTPMPLTCDALADLKTVIG